MIPLLTTILTILTTQKLPLLLHAIIESAAASTFILNPSSQLPPLSSPSSSQSLHPPPPPSPPSSISTSRSRSPLTPSKRHTTLPPTTSTTKAVKTPAEVEREREREEINLVLLNYGGLLVATNFVCLVFILRREFDEISALVSLCVATYHVWPIYRAGVRIRNSRRGVGGVKGKGAVDGGRKNDAGKKVLGGPVVHLLVHVLLLGGLVWSGCSGLM